MKTLTCILAMLALDLAACSTPQVVLDQANHGAALSASLYTELIGYRKAQSGIAASRIETTKDIERQVAAYQRSTAFDDRIAGLAGRDDEAKLYKAIDSLADSIAADEAAYSKRLAEMNERLDVLLKPLPDGASKLAAVQEALATLGTELSISERVKVVTGFARGLKDEIDKVKKAAEAEMPAKQAPVQPPPESPTNSPTN